MDVTCDALLAILFAKADINKVPLGGSFELTPRCTLDCKMCYIHRKETDKSVLTLEKDAKFWIDLAEKARDAGTLLLLLTGGEPMLRPDFDEIYVACKKLGLLVTVNTNATLIDDEKIRLFQEYPPHKVNVTLYGASAETYGRLCGSEAAYAKVTEAIRKMVDAGIKVKINYSITPDNVGDIPAVNAFAKELGLQTTAASYMFTPTRGGACEFRLTPEEAAKAKLEWSRHSLSEEAFAKLIESEESPPSGDVTCSEPINCRAGCSTFWVTWQGEMSLCGMMAKPSVPITDFSDAWRLICAERDKIYLPAKCNGCEYRKDCDMCAAVAVAETGKSDCVPDYACKKAHEYAKLISNLKQRQ